MEDEHLQSRHVSKPLGQNLPSLSFRLGSGLFWNAAANIASQGGTFVTNLLAANILGINAFGQFSLIQFTFLSVIGVTQGAVATTTTRYIAELRSTDKARVGKVLGVCSVFALALGALGTLVVMLGADLLARSVGGDSTFTAGVFMGGGFILFSVVAGFQAGALSGLEAYRTLATNSMLAAVLQVVVCAGMAWLAGVNGALGGLVVATVFRC